MSRRKLIAGNWKLHKTVNEAVAAVGELRRLLAQVRDCDIVVAPTYTALWAVAKKLEDSPIQLAAQDLFYEDKGAFTGTVSGAMLKEAGCTFVLVGHSERRQFFGETLDSSRLRTLAAYRAGLIPILCVGESLAEREAGRTNEILAAQLDAVVPALKPEQLAQLVVAYEPVSAIGTGKVASPQQAQEAHNFIRERLRSASAPADKIRILYGGSVKADNAATLLSQPDIDGALVGGASLEPDSFAAIVKARA